MGGSIATTEAGTLMPAVSLVKHLIIHTRKTHGHQLPKGGVRIL